MTGPIGLKHATLLTGGTLALAIASASHAVDFEVGDTTASVYGYAKLDMIYDVDNKLGDLAARPRILIDGQEGSDGHTTMHAYQSRLGFKTATPMGGSKLTTMVEVDWFDNAPEGGDLRLRHAFGSWNGITAGKTWTNFGSLLGKTPTIDLAPQPGQSKVGRKAQLRYSWANWHIALENPDPEDYRDGVAANFNPKRGVYIEHKDAKTGLPDLTLRYQNQAAGLHYSAAAMVRQLEVDGAGMDDTAAGYGLNLAARYPASDTLTLRGALTWGDGIGEYMQNNPSAPGYWNGSNIETIEAWGANISMSLTAGPGAINLGYGISQADLDDARDAGIAGVEGANEQFTAVHLNYIWSPIQRVSYGIEAAYHTREVVDGRDGDALRLQGMVKYSF
ncbi:MULTISPECIES: hypothetical protein [unclassified Halomonas]|uniref:hypothetical protein n=1 Tax=unclassified Halomonas TaxID=2609666 RepID=UPI0028865A33|nr:MULTISPECIES: hypothetical protein [unclassified Halomonas]MDT0501021.1 hypothetical protein [Halomonas sp. PAR7]MDT0513212.1 hypothetical protein [Halomonas sp. LES1]MDT0593019.1 hypothetical protein [Halomonas sp. PAR8]